MSENNTGIRGLIIPLERYPHLNEDQTLQEGIETFMSFRTGEEERLCYSLLLVVNDRDQLVGKLSLVDIMHGLAPRLIESAKVAKFEGKGAEYENLSILYEDSIFAHCGQNRNKPIKSLIRPIDFSLPADTHILKALAMMSHRKDFNVPVTEDGCVIGVLRLEEVFMTMCNTFCKI